MGTTHNQGRTQGRSAAGQKVAEAIRQEMNRLFDNFVQDLGSATPLTRFGEGSFGQITPQVNVSETDKEYKVTAELPGIEEKDIEVSLGQNVLTLKGEKRAEREDQQKNYHLMERSFGSFQRTIALPVEVDHDKVSASFKNGVLTVRLPKAEGAQARAIQIQMLPGDPTTPP